MRFSLTVTGDDQRHVVVDAGPDTPLGEAAAAIAQAVSAPGAVLHHASKRLDPELPLAAAGLYDGDVVAFEPLPRPDAPPPPVLELRVVNGPGAGVRTALPPGQYRIGSAENSFLRITPAPDLAAEIIVTVDGAVSVRVHSGARLLRVVAPKPGPVKHVKGEPKIVPPRQPPTPAPAGGPGALAWPADADLLVGDSILRWAEPRHAESSVKPTDEGVRLDFNRPPRIIEPVLAQRQRIPQRPVYKGRARFPIVMIITPVVMGTVFVLVFHQLYFLMFTAFSPIFAIANWISGRRGGRKQFEADFAEWVVKKAEKEREIARAMAGERRLRVGLAEDPAAVRETAAGPDRRLWERRRTDADHLVLRIGTVDQPSMLEIEDLDRGGEFKDKVRWNLPSIPIAVSVAERGVVGLAGPPERIRRLTGWLLAAAAVQHSPAGVRFVVLTGPGGERDWEWLRWLPHLRAPAGHGLSIGNDPQSVARRVAELLAVVELRIEMTKQRSGGALFGDPDLVVLVDGARAMRDVPGFVQLLEIGPRVRVFFLCVDREVRMLPKEAASVIVDDGRELTLRQDGLPEVGGIRPDLVADGWLEAVSRSLTPLRDATLDDAAIALPDRVRLADLLGLAEPDPDVIAARWQLAPASTRVPIGIAADGVASVDLAKDGPHALIAGTTGSGKSELLQTLIAALAVANHPEELGFLLIDYKGGSAFRDCVRLPHTLGMVTDLDGHLVQRVLTSLAAELRRREQLLADHKAKDQPDYLARRAADPSLPPLPRLVLVVDEFATLVREVPEFIPGIVSLTQRGRSLGMHLVLATQRPAGVVTADIRANTNLRIALRVLDRIESVDVIDSGEAAQIPPDLPGRAMVRLGHQSVLTFQTAYSGAPYVPQAEQDATAGGGTPASAFEAPWSSLGSLPPPGATARSADAADGPTDLSVLVDALCQAASDLGLEPQPRPWLPPLPRTLTLAEVARVAAQGSAQGSPARSASPAPVAIGPVAIGLVDLPAEQIQRPMLFDLETVDHLYLLGTARSGRTQALRTLAGALARAHSTADVHLYGLDAAGGGLSALTALPHTGAVVNRNELERIDRLIARLGRELTARQDLLTRYHSGNLTELRSALPPGPRPAHILLLADGWDALHAEIHELDNGRLLHEVHRLLREGGAAGIHLVIAGDRSLGGGRMGALNSHRVLLRMTDKTEFMMIDMHPGTVPDDIPPGRGWHSEGASEVQFALLAPEASGQAQTAALRQIAEAATLRDEGVRPESRPFTIGRLPLGIGFTEAFKQVARTRPMLGLLGIGGDGTGPVIVDFAGRGNNFAVSGPPASGRSTALATLAISLLAGQTRLLVIAPQESPLRRLAADPNVTVLSGTSITGDDIRESLAALGAPCVILLDDVDAVIRNHTVDAVMRELIATGRDQGIGIAVAGTGEAFTQNPVTWLGEFRRARQGVLISPQHVAEGDLAGIRLPGELVRRPPTPGRGLIADPATGQPVTIALPLTELRQPEAVDAG